MSISVCLSPCRSVCLTTLSSFAWFPSCFSPNSRSVFNCCLYEHLICVCFSCLDVIFLQATCLRSDTPRLQRQCDSGYSMAQVSDLPAPLRQKIDWFCTFRKSRFLEGWMFLFLNCSVVADSSLNFCIPFCPTYAVFSKRKRRKQKIQQAQESMQEPQRLVDMVGIRRRGVPAHRRRPLPHPQSCCWIPVSLPVVRMTTCGCPFCCRLCGPGGLSDSPTSYRGDIAESSCSC